MALEAHNLHASYPSLRIVLSRFPHTERCSMTALLGAAGHTVAEPPAGDHEVSFDVWIERVSSGTRRSDLFPVVDRLRGASLILVSGAPDVELALVARDCQASYVPAVSQTRKLLAALPPTRRERRRDKALVVGDTEAFQSSDPRMRQIAALIDSLAESRRPIVISGEVGTGKTTLAQSLCARLGGKAGVETLDLACAPAADDVARVIRSTGDGVLVLEELSAARDSHCEQIAALLCNAAGTGASPRLVITRTAAGNDALPPRLAPLLSSHVSIRVPALRERRSDLPALVRHFVERMGADRTSHCNNERLLSARGWLALCDRPLYGNLVELETCLALALDRSGGEPIGPAQLPPPVPRRATSDEIRRELRARLRAPVDALPGAPGTLSMRPLWRRPMST